MKKLVLSFNAFLPARAIWENPGENAREAVTSYRSEIADSMMKSIENLIMEKKELGEVTDSKLREISRLIEIDARNTANLIPADLLQQLTSEFSDKSIMEACAVHPNTPQNLLKKMYDSAKESTSNIILSRLAQNPSTPAAYLVEIYNKYKNQKTDDGAVRYMMVSLAKNKNLPKALMSRLSELPDHDVLLEIARNPSISEDTLMRLAYMVDEAILRRLIHNRSSSENVLHQVIKSLHELGTKESNEGYDMFLNDIHEANEKLERRYNQKKKR